MAINPLKRKKEKELKELSLEAIKNTVFRYDKEYFSAIGENDSAVVRFHELIKKEDIISLSKEWKKLSNRFVQLERETGHEGRPLIMDYYHWYELDIKEMKERLR